MKKNLLYGFFALSMAVVGLSSCDPVDSDDHSLSGVVINKDDVSMTVTKVSDKEFTLTNTSKEVSGVTYYFCTDGKKIEEAPVGASTTFTVKKNGVYTVVLYAISGCDQKEARHDIMVDWFVEDVDPQWLGYTAGANLLAEANPTIGTWFADGGWTALETQPTIDGDLQALDFTIPSGTGENQWQGQVQIENTGVKISSGKRYDFSVAIISSTDFMGATVKPQKQGDDNTFFSDARYAIKAGVNVITLNDLAGFDGELKIAMDFGGAPEGTEITVKRFYLAEHSNENPALDAPLCFFDYSSESNLLLGKEGDTTPSWFADGGWNQIDTPKFDGNAEKVEFTIPAGMGGDQWQGQAKFAFDVALSASKTYDFSVVILSDKDLPGVTIKPQARNNDGISFSAERYDVKAGVPFALRISAAAGFGDSFLLVTDFGGSPEGANVSIIGAYLGEHK